MLPGSTQKRYLQGAGQRSGPGSSNKRIRSWLRTIYPYSLAVDTELDPLPVLQPKLCMSCPPFSLGNTLKCVGR